METRLHKYLIESKQKNTKSICAVVKVMEWQRGGETTPQKPI